jgi:hypothetical protein
LEVVLQEKRVVSFRIRTADFRRRQKESQGELRRQPDICTPKSYFASWRKKDWLAGIFFNWLVSYISFALEKNYFSYIWLGRISSHY